MATIQGIYLALFGRPADPAGLAYWTQQTNNGADLSKLIGVMTTLPEATLRFSNMTPTAVVTSIYQALFNRLPDAAGLAFSTDKLASGQLTVGTLTINILDGAQGGDKTIIDNKIKAADNFTASLDTPAEIAAYVGTAAAEIGRGFLKNVTADPATIPTPAKAQETLNTLPGIAPAGGQAPSTGGGGGTVPTAPAVEQFSVTKTHQNLTSVGTDGMLFVGKGNPATGFTKTVADGDNKLIELGLDVRYRADAKDVAKTSTLSDGTEVYEVEAKDTVRFAYSVGVKPETGDAKLNLDAYDYKLSIDRSAGSGTDFLELKLVKQDTGKSSTVNGSDSPYEWVSNDKSIVIKDDGGAIDVTQNIQALQWYSNGGKSLAAGDVYDVKLEAFRKGESTAFAQSAIKIVGAADTALSSSTTLADVAKTAQGYMLAGNGNSINDFAIVKSATTGLELALGAKYAGGATIQGTVTDGVTHFAAPETDKVRFVFSVASTDNDDLSANKFKLKIDTDPTAAEKFIEFDLVQQNSNDPYNNGGGNSPYEWVSASGIKIIDDGGNGKVTQNIQNIAWYDAEAGNVLKKGSYAVSLEAYSADGVTLVGVNKVVFDIIDAP